MPRETEPNQESSASNLKSTLKKAGVGGMDEKTLFFFGGFTGS